MNDVVRGVFAPLAENLLVLAGILSRSNIASSYTPTVLPVSYSSKKMETTIGHGGDMVLSGGRRASGTLSSSPTNSPVPPPASLLSSSSASRHITSLSQSTTTVVKSVTPASDAAITRSPLRLIHEIKTASQESQADSGHGSGHGSTQPPTTQEFQPFFSSDINPATESSKLLSTPSRRVEGGGESEDRPVTPLLGLTSGTKMDLLRSKHHSANTTWRFLSLLYALVLIVLGSAFPLSEIIAVQVKPLFYQAYYVYLFGVALFFLIFAYFFLLQTGRSGNRKHLLTFKRGVKGYRMETVEGSCHDEEAGKAGGGGGGGGGGHRGSLTNNTGTSKSGSFYLRMGALVFGLGAMIYSCLEFGQYFEIPESSACKDILSAVVPACRFMFIFIQLYFVFLNSKIRTDRFTTLVRFGLMHMVATNVCIWLSVLIGETKHELELSLSDPERVTPRGYENHPYPLGRETANDTGNASLITANTFKKPLQIYLEQAAAAMGTTLLEVYPKSCRAQTIIGNILQQAGPFLYPCVVQYVLICAAMLFVMWASMSTRATSYAAEERSLSTVSLSGGKRQRYTVDCHGATRGLFVGLLMLILAIISLILFFVWILRTEPSYYRLAVLQAYIVEIILYTATAIAVCCALFQVRHLKFESHAGSLLNDILLIISQVGVYIFCTFILISGHHTVLLNFTSPQALLMGPERLDLFTLVSTLLQTLQATLQTLFLLDATRRRPCKPEHLRDKPGRELVTFLLVCNFALFAIDSLEAWRQTYYPAQTRFYGAWTWTIVMNIAIPLKIFYRFHSSVCLSEIWKKAWKLKSRPSTPTANS
ncbi:hypothetical protein BV898_07635 [Hypsibius exemplaris]|uniref:Otopetrin-2 n=1 Tax=Hypsibius exemplaris TaxID=2072580 RepID=A0A1W0WSR3_HYPEX|nr:hypothetical protein BV898_07635 [Hypsibius exemplaris]